MTSSELIQPRHLLRKAVIYIRQSTVHQVLSNLESQSLQRAMREHARHLGWSEDRIESVEADTAQSAQQAAGRDAYRRLLNEVALGQVGIVLSYETNRLSRNCSDWYPLLDLCAINDCLIADRDGVYDPASANGRMILGMKGIISEVELHTLRGRLIAGIQNKASRGELALALPAGLVRQEDGSVVKEPNLQVQQAIELVFKTFLQLKSMIKVVVHFREHSLLVPKRHRNDETVWRPPTLAGISAVLRNPAYAGAFVYGRTRTERKPGKARPQQRRRAMNEWRVIVLDRYPAYVSWETFNQIQAILQDNYAEYDINRARGVPREGSCLLQGIVYCGECGHKMVVQYKGGNRYLCNHLRAQTRAPVCQYLPADPVDTYVVRAFFEALSPVELELYEQAQQIRSQQQREVEQAQERELQRLRYETELARRRYDKVDPDNRLVASELERRWEQALNALNRTEAAINQQNQQRSNVVPIHLPRELRTAFESLGKSLPGAWEKKILTRTRRKALLRCLIDKVVLHRQQRDRVLTRIIWRGGATSESEVALPVGSAHDLARFEEMEARILALEAQGLSDAEIADRLTEEGFRSPQRDVLLRSTVQITRLRHKRIHRFTGPRPRRVDGFLTLPQLAQKIDVTPHWLYNLIRRGVIKIDRSPHSGLYLFVDHPDIVETFIQLKEGSLESVDCRREHQDA